MLGIVFTTIEEAAVLADLRSEARFDDLEEGTPIQVGNALVAVAGTGKIKGTLTTERLLQSHDLTALIHVGTGVGLDEEFETGTVVGITFVLEGDRVELEAPTYPRMPLECPFDVEAEGTLVSQDHMPGDSEEKSYWERLADVRDETGYPVAYVAAQHGTPCHILKEISGHSEGSSIDSADQSNPLASTVPVLRKLLDEEVPLSE